VFADNHGTLITSTFIFSFLFSFHPSLVSIPRQQHPHHLEDLMSLKLGGNPWTCDCKLGWIREWIKDIKSKSMPPTVMMTINNLNSIHNNNMLFSSPMNGSQVVLSRRQENEVRLQQALSGMREASCVGSGMSLLQAFRTELRECRRNCSLTSYLDSRLQVFQYISLLLFLLLFHN